MIDKNKPDYIGEIQIKKPHNTGAAHFIIL